MGLFGSKKNDKVVDLSNYYRKQQERINSLKENQQNLNEGVSVPSATKVSSPSESSGMFGIFGGSTPSAMPVENSSQDSLSDSDDKRKKLTKRILDMTNKLEEVSNQIYHMQQRIEVLERKLDVSRF